MNLREKVRPFEDLIFIDIFLTLTLIYVAIIMEWDAEFIKCILSSVFIFFFVSLPFLLLKRAGKISLTFLSIPFAITIIYLFVSFFSMQSRKCDEISKVKHEQQLQEEQSQKSPKAVAYKG